MDLSFLPQLPFALSAPIMIGALLAAGLLAGEAINRYASLPRITGYALAGVVLGPQLSGVLSPEVLRALSVLIDLSVGLIVFELGFRFDWRWLKSNRWLLATAVAESLFGFGAIFGTLVYFGYAPVLAASAAAIGTATSPAIVMLVTHELRAEGQITERTLLFTAVNSVFAYVTLTLLLPLLHLRLQAGWLEAVLRPAYILGGSLVAGVAACMLMLGLARWLGKREDRQFVLLVAMVVLTVGVARSLNLSVMIALMALGMLARNFDRRHVLMPLRFGHGGQLFFVILFVLTGAGLNFGAWTTAAWLVAALLVARFLGKALAILVFGRLSGVRPGGAGLLAIALLPMSGLAVGMVRDTTQLFPVFGQQLGGVLLAAVALSEVLSSTAPTSCRSSK